MNAPLKSVLLSVSLHGAIILLAFALGSRFNDPDRQVVIDFSVIPPAASSTGPPQAMAKAPDRKTAIKRPATPERPRRPDRAAPEKIVPPEPDTPPVEQPATDAVPTVADSEPETSAATEGPPESAPPTGADGTPNSAMAAGSGASATSGESPDSEAGKRYLKEHFTYIRDRIRRNIIYPPPALSRGWCGEVLVSFVIDRDGRASAKKIIRSSGHTVLDNNVIATIEAVSPFPRPPVKAELRIPIIYSLE